MTRPRVLGHVIDAQTRCTHYSTVLDVIAIRFYCCGEYYPCRLCHDQVPAQHKARRWPVAEHDARAVMCGVCDHQLGIIE
ncbi:MAG: CHY zinc finger protein, partial [Micrococcaceae bacterium]|nr:CHY zinc finger protein [Micrococcaceae bacterium]